MTLSEYIQTQNVQIIAKCIFTLDMPLLLVSIYEFSSHLHSSTLVHDILWILRSICLNLGSECDRKSECERNGQVISREKARPRQSNEPEQPTGTSQTLPKFNFPIYPFIAVMGSIPDPQFERMERV